MFPKVAHMADAARKGPGIKVNTGDGCVPVPLDEGIPGPGGGPEIIRGIYRSNGCFLLWHSVRR